MLTAIRSSKPPPTPITRVTDALRDLPLPHTKPQRRVDPAVIVGAVAGLVALLMGIAAFIFRDKLASFVSRGDVGEAQALDAARE